MAKAIAFSGYGDPDVLHLIGREPPLPGPGQVRVRVRTAGVNPVDAKLRRGQFDGIVPVTFPQTLGNEFAGVVDLVGDDVTTVTAGTEVLGFTSAAAYAEFVVVPADQVAVKPAGLPWEVAGALSAVGQTAYHALAELRVTAGETVLIHAAAGGVGTMAVQLARAAGATVIGTASEGNHEYLRALGAVPVRYGEGLADRVRAVAPGGVHAVLDAIGGEAVAVSVGLVPDRDRIGTIADESAAGRYGVRRLRGARSSATLAMLATRCAQGELRLPIWKMFPLAAAAAAHREVETGHVRGKVVLIVAR